MLKKDEFNYPFAKTSSTLPGLKGLQPWGTSVGFSSYEFRSLSAAFSPSRAWPTLSLSLFLSYNLIYYFGVRAVVMENAQNASGTLLSHSPVSLSNIYLQKSININNGNTIPLKALLSLHKQPRSLLTSPYLSSFIPLYCNLILYIIKDRSPEDIEAELLAAEFEDRLDSLRASGLTRRHVEVRHCYLSLLLFVFEFLFFCV